MITLYSTGCPKCNVLKTKLKAKGLEFNEVNNVEEMQSLGISQVPMLRVDDGDLMTFVQANSWINHQ